MEKTDMVLKNILTKIKENTGILLGISMLGAILALFAESYALAFLLVFPILFFLVNAYLASKSDIPKYISTSDKQKKRETNEPQNYSSYRAELFASARKKQKK